MGKLPINYSSINRNAEEIAEGIYINMGKQFPNLELLLKWAEGNFDTTITISRTNLNCSGVIFYDPATKGWKLQLNSSEPSCRQRFTFCHEIAHLMMSKYLVFGFSIEGENQKKLLERFCDRFAAAFLMPSELFINKWKALSNKDLLKVARIARYFSVSIDSVKYRAAELHLLEGKIWGSNC